MIENFPKMIKVAALNRSAFFELSTKDSTKPKGIDGSLLELLSQTFAFEYKVNSPTDGEYGILKADGNWSGIIGMVSRSEADFGMSLISPTYPRLKVVDSSIPYIITDFTYATKHPGTSPTAYSYVHAFDVYTWMCLAALLILMPAVFRLLVKNCSYIDTQLAVFGHLLRIPIPMKVLEKKPLTVLWYFCAFVLSASYAGIISSLLFTPLHDLPIENVEELSEAITRGNFKVKSLKGSALVPSFIGSQSEHLRNIGKSMKKNNWYFEPDFDVHEELSQPDVAIIEHRLYMNIFFGFPPFASEFVSEDSFRSMFAGIVLSKKFCCKEKLDSALTRIIEAGIINKFIRDEQRRYDCYHHTLDSLNFHEFKPLSVEDLLGAFFLFMSGFVISLIGLVSEMIYYKCCNCRRSQSSLLCG